MAPLTLKLIMLSLLFLSTIAIKTVYGENGDDDEQYWCIADEQSTDDELQGAMDWACGKGGADCSKIQANQSCYFPNTVMNHASFAFNNYFQKFKHSGASCYFRGAAIITQVDPSHDSCHYDFIA